MRTSRRRRLGVNTVGTVAFSPLTLSPAVWLKADALGLSDGTAVASWTDSSGNSRPATQATGAAQPLLKTGIVNNLPVVRLDGVNDYLAVDPGSAFLTASTLTVFIVAVHRNVLDGSTLMSVRGVAQTADWSNTSSGVIGYSSAGAQACFRANTQRSTLAGLPANGTPVVAEAVFDGTNNTFLRNGTAGTVVATTGAFNADKVYVGARYDSGVVDFWQVDFAEILVFPTALSSTNRSAVRAYLGAKYAITVI